MQTKYQHIHTNIFKLRVYNALCVMRYTYIPKSYTNQNSCIYLMHLAEAKFKEYLHQASCDLTFSAFSATILLNYRGNSIIKA